MTRCNVHTVDSPSVRVSSQELELGSWVCCRQHAEVPAYAMFQAADINALFGFRIECIERLGERNGLWAWTRLNSLFNWLPLAACIEDKVLCMHGGECQTLLVTHCERL